MWEKLANEFRHAFSLNVKDLTEEERMLLKKAAAKVVKKRMNAPVMLFLESLIPVNFVASQAMVMLSPYFGTFFSSSEYKKFCSALEKRECIEQLIREIEQFEQK